MSTTSASSDLMIVFCTFPGAEEAGDAARTLVGEALCACMNVLPGVQSIYRWKDQVVNTAEVLCIIKTHRDRHEALIARLSELHPYDVPEMVSLHADAVSEPYLRWVTGECDPNRPPHSSDDE